MRAWTVMVTAVTAVAAPAAAHAFCGFYVSGADAKLFNNATQVVLMRKGTRTVLSMQNNYQGPPDLVFKSTSAIAGGREWRGPSGRLEEGSVAAPTNNFQARYAIRHEWTGPIACANPVRGRWGGPPGGSQQIAKGPVAARDLAFVPRGKTKLGMIVRQDVPEIDIVAGQAETPAAAAPPAASTADAAPAAAPTPPAPATQPVKKDKNGCAVGGRGAGGWLALFILGLAIAPLWTMRAPRPGRVVGQARVARVGVAPAASPKKDGGKQ